MSPLAGDRERGGDVLVAPATPPGVSALAVVRLTGRPAETRAVARRLAPDFPAEPVPRQALLLRLVDAEGRALDRAVVLLWAAPHSPTGEEVVEFVCHGSPGVVLGLVDAARRAGARPAERGEFTRRALANGKLDLAEAEGLAALARAESRGAARRALGLVEGALSSRVHAARERALDALAALEAALDFAEDVPAEEAARAGSGARRGRGGARARSRSGARRGGPAARRRHPRPAERGEVDALQRARRKRPRDRDGDAGHDARRDHGDRGDRGGERDARRHRGAARRGRRSRADRRRGRDAGGGERGPGRVRRRCARSGGTKRTKSFLEREEGRARSS